MKTFAIAGAVAIALGQAPAARHQTPALDLVRRADQRAQTFRSNVPAVIAEEHYTQKVMAPGGAVTSRTIESEMLLIWLPEDQTWMSVRNVRVVDGQPVPDSAQWLERVLARRTTGLQPALRELQEESARFDFGPVSRSIGSPALAMQFLVPAERARFTFTDEGVERIDGAVARKVLFAETKPPSHVVINGDVVPVSGALWLWGSDASLARTRVTAESATFGTATVEVEFRADAELGVPVPVRMSERYSPRRGDSLSCLARYSNHRRFNVER